MCTLQAIVDDPLMRHSAVLVFANKQDLVSLSNSLNQEAQDVCHMYYAFTAITKSSGWTSSCSDHEAIVASGHCCSEGV